MFKNWNSNLYGAKFDPGQKFICYQDKECGWRRITFKVDDLPCQLVHIIPGVGGTSDFWGQLDSPLALNITHCGTDIPFTTENIVYTDDGRIKLVYPGGAISPAGKRVSKPSSNNKSLEERLGTLKKLENTGLITKEEAAAKRKEILKNL
jgi:hypothetical protein